MSAPFLPAPDRQALVGGHMLAGVEADILHDDVVLRGQRTELHRLLTCWDTASEQAVATHLRLLEPRHEGYEDADLTGALGDYRFARGLVLTQLRAITDHLTQTQETHT